MKIALVQDGLMCRAGGEQVALCFHRAFPEAPIYTQCYQPHLTFSEFNSCDIRTSWLQKFVKTDDMMKRLFFPLGMWAMQSHDLTSYDVVLMSGTHCAKYVKTSPEALVISYSFTPFRLAWDPMSYAQYARSTGLKRFVFDRVINLLRRTDFKYAQRPNFYVAMTEETAKRLCTAYQIKGIIDLISPPVNVNNFHLTKTLGNYFLVVSRLEHYKRVDLVIEAFNQLGYPLVVVGKGLQENEIKALARSNVTFMQGMSTSELATVYARCRAFIFPQHEDYGITPLEANASGRPVIAYGSGGVLTTQIPVSTNPSRATALFFDDQTSTDLIGAIKRFQDIESQFDPLFIRAHAETFNEAKFINNIRQFVNKKYLFHKKLPIN